MIPNVESLFSHGSQVCTWTSDDSKAKGNGVPVCPRMMATPLRRNCGKGGVVKIPL